MAKSNNYWVERQLETFTEGEKSALKLAKDLKTNYDNAVNQIDKEINAFYDKFAAENGITLSQAKKLLDKNQLKSFNSQLKEYIDYAKEHEFDKDYISELNLLKYRTKLSRLEELKINIKFQLAKLLKGNQDEIKKSLFGLYDDAYLQNIFNITSQLGMSISFTRPAVKVIEKYLKFDINLGNYSIGENGIWENKLPKLTNILNVKIPQGIVLGQNPKKVAQIAAKQLDVDYNNAVRLVRTEYNYIFNQAASDSFKECGIGQYQILATLDERTCDSCGPLDLMVVNVKDEIVGVNSPPFHVNCRCVKKAYFEPDEFDIPTTRIAKDKDGKPYYVPSDLTFTEWKKGLTKHKGGVMYWKPKEA